MTKKESFLYFLKKHNEEERKQRVPMSFFAYLQLTFITLKLIEEINWSWWLVLSPLLFRVFFRLLICLKFWLDRLIKNNNSNSYDTKKRI